ncbi:Alcohol dehydrogenase zinc-binding domain protein [Chthoniobacter flavus Ellin428]|uniref:Alcohol dehydrogenase zinc-binding domain protein n=1 Tax=Chthoniobacter flavus Ellin428 TaxID=497964 RepID=B4CWY8_9BACT|nr:NADPH:quinone reductase [Chthoniobacter flavus]EDY21308.1 Alcohol dehydrogenase zinc-binding domain protein [Chthoniobacter flavus Ellin428]TCO84923.1 NADPH2:quinone reductase [Chthoniobacter flavus]
MKAIRVQQFGEPDVLQVATVPDLTPAAGQILVRIQAIGINPVETYIRSGKYAKLPPPPYTPGTDGAGTIAALGSGVTGWKVGDRVYLAGSVTGTYAEQALCEPVHLHPLPDNVSFTQGAALGVPYTTAHVALFHRGHLRSGEIILIHGATGGVGLAAVQLAQTVGARVLATGGTDEGRLLLLDQGAYAVFDHHSKDYPERILDTTDGRGVDFILEMLASVNLGKDLPMLANNGRVVIVGSRGPVEINPRDLMARNADVRGVMVFGTPAPVLTEAHLAIVSGLKEGKLHPIIAREFPLADAAEAHKTVMAPGASGKIVLVN